MKALWLRGLRRGWWLVWLSPLLLPLLLASAWLHSYHRLTAETLIAELSFVPLGEQRFEASLLTGDRCHPQRYLLLGDQWRLDAQFLKWKPWANLLGVDARYRLERLEGRYQSTDDQNSKPTQAHTLGEQPVFNLTKLLGRTNFLLDAQYGSSTYQTVDGNLIYQVYRTQSGIITRSFPRPAPRLEGGNMVIEIRRGCAEQQGVWLGLANWVDSRLNALMGRPS